MWLTTERNRERPMTDSLLTPDGLADVVTFGRLTLANPDVVERISAGAPFNEPDRATFYGGDEHGYTDYPMLSAATIETER
jgi:N-ethylmaleimide reductase